jgi:hypothetical protein
MTANKEADCATADRIWRLYVVRGRVTMRNLRKREWPSSEVERFEHLSAMVLDKNRCQ